MIIAKSVRLLPFLLIALSLPPAALGAENRWQLRENIVAKVNGQVISNGEVYDIAMFFARQREMIGPDKPGLSEKDQLSLGTEAMRIAVRMAIIEQMARELQVGVRKDDLIEELERRELEDKPLHRRLVMSDLLFEEIMRREGLGVLTPSPKDVREYYHNHQDKFDIPRLVFARQITIPKATPETRAFELAKAKRVRKQALSGKNEFGELASQQAAGERDAAMGGLIEIGRASCRERV
jgi:hypothetical protein